MQTFSHFLLLGKLERTVHCTYTVCCSQCSSRQQPNTVRHTNRPPAVPKRNRDNAQILPSLGRKHTAVIKLEKSGVCRYAGFAKYTTLKFSNCAPCCSIFIPFSARVCPSGKIKERAGSKISLFGFPGKAVCFCVCVS